VPCLRRLVNLDGFSFGVDLMVFLNTIILAMDRYPLPSDSQMRIFDQISFACVVIFTLEMLLKICGLGLYYYFHDNFNKFDAIIVCTSLMELAITPPPFLLGADQSEGSGNVGFSALRILRIIRVLRIARLVEMFPSMQQAFNLIFQMLPTLLAFSFLLALFVYIFSLAGMQLFANKFWIDDAGRSYSFTEIRDPPIHLENRRANYDTITGALLLTFQVFTGEDWPLVM
jgi:hypothetical protein